MIITSIVPNSKIKFATQTIAYFLGMWSLARNGKTSFFLKYLRFNLVINLLCLVENIWLKSDCPKDFFFCCNNSTNLCTIVQHVRHLLKIMVAFSKDFESSFRIISSISRLVLLFLVALQI